MNPKTPGPKAPAAHRDLLLGLLAEIRPVPMIATLTLAYVGVALGGGTFASTSTGLVLLAAALGLFIAHLRDTELDLFVRGEDRLLPPAGLDGSNGLLSRELLTRLNLTASVLFWIAVAALVWLTDEYALIPVGGAAFLLAQAYGMGLDLHPIGAAFAYPAGAILALWSGYLAAGGAALSPLNAMLTSSLLLALVGAKIISDLYDLPHDPAFGKRTIAVLFGALRARILGIALVTGSLLLVFFIGSAGGWTWPQLAVTAVAAGIPPVGGWQKPLRATYTVLGGLYAVILLLALSPPVL